MEIESTHIEGLKVISPRVFRDDRGYFFESFNAETWSKLDLPTEFVQDNQSLSSKGILRGLHFQADPFAQGKLVRVIKGAVLDVAVDIRKNSPTYGEHYSVELNEENLKMFWIPAGFAHGFLTLQDGTIFSYKCTSVYDQASEGGIAWDDKNINIDWGINDPILSEKDKINPSLKNFSSPF